MQIGVIAKQSGFSKDTLRYYEKIGLIQLSSQSRGDNNYRIYDSSILQELHFIKGLKNIGFTLNEIKELKQQGTKGAISCSSIGPLIHKKLDKIEVQLAELQLQKKKLELLMNTCNGKCTDTFIDSI